MTSKMQDFYGSYLGFTKIIQEKNEILLPLEEMFQKIFTERNRRKIRNCYIDATWIC